MDMQKLKDAMETIEFSASMQERIKQNCLLELTEKKEVSSMKKNTHPLKRTVLIAAVLVLCLPVIGLAVSNSGAFKDVKNLFGTVTGTEYETVTGEIELLSSVENDILTVKAVLPADHAPFSACELLSMEGYQIMDGNDTLIADSQEIISSEIIEGQAVFTLSVQGLEKSDYTLLIDTFIGSKKADQPLSIHGNWEIPFSI